MKKKSKTLKDYYKVASTPRLYNPVYFIIVICSFILAAGYGLIIGLLVSIAEQYKQTVLEYDDLKDKRYEWTSEQFLSYRDYLDELGSRIKVEGDVSATHSALTIAKMYGIEAEVVSEALNFMKSNPKLTLAEALNMGLEEWDV